MKGFIELYRSSVGKKVIMALTGSVLVLFVLGHMAGNLKAFFGFDPSGVHRLDHYAEFLRTIAQDLLGHGGFLWIARVVLLGCVLLHIATALQLSYLNRRARPIGYERTKFRSATPASRTMVIGGLLISVFIVLHILHMTTGQLHRYGFVEGRVYANVYSAFSHGSITILYVLAMCVLWLHLFHGTWSLFQTLGIDNPRWNPTIRAAAKLISFLVFVGFVSVPLSVYFGVLPHPSSVVEAKS